ncbi:MAG: hypothetical protein FWG28_08270, partial [Clostridiales bacterium]|nr:hypothetical protein [Clostridiales bacterium]
MIIVVIPLAVLLVFILNPRIPVVGGHIQAGFIITGLIALLMGGVYRPADWLLAWLDGVSRIAWVIGLSVLGSIYAETQVEMGTMDTVIKTLRSIFGFSPKGLIIAVVIAITIAGALLGDAIAASTVIGVLVIRSLAELELSGEQISATIVMG